MTNDLQEPLPDQWGPVTYAIGENDRAQWFPATDKIVFSLSGYIVGIPADEAGEIAEALTILLRVRAQRVAEIDRLLTAEPEGETRP